MCKYVQLAKCADVIYKHKVKMSGIILKGEFALPPAISI